MLSNSTFWNRVSSIRKKKPHPRKNTHTHTHPKRYIFFWPLKNLPMSETCSWMNKHVVGVLCAFSQFPKPPKKTGPRAPRDEVPAIGIQTLKMAMMAMSCRRLGGMGWMKQWQSDRDIPGQKIHDLTAEVVSNCGFVREFIPKSLDTSGLGITRTICPGGIWFRRCKHPSHDAMVENEGWQRQCRSHWKNKCHTNKQIAKKQLILQSWCAPSVIGNPQA